MESTRFGTFSQREQDWFWQLIESARPVDDDSDVHCGKLLDLLTELSARKIVLFERINGGYDDDAYREDLWDIAYHINGGCSDDGFYDFRVWLIMQGEAVYKLALEDPESLAEVMVTVEEMESDCGSIAHAAYEKITGEEFIPQELLFPGGKIKKIKLQGNSVSQEEFPQTYPMLWQLLDDFPEIQPQWPKGNNQAAARIAQTIHDSKLWSDLPILADALEESGCTDAFLLEHLRANRHHARQCWAVDLIVNAIHSK